MRHVLRRLSLPLALLLLAAALGLPSCGRGAERGLPENPEELFAYPISQIFIRRDTTRPMESIRRAIDVLEEIQRGRSFAAVAQERSNDPMTAQLGGFMGFLRPQGGDERLEGALQALVPGVVAGPVDSKEGVHLLLRHSFNDGAELERENSIPAYGFFITPIESPNPDEARTKEQTRALAEDLVAKIDRGEIQPIEAALRYASEKPRREDLYLGLVSRVGPSQEMYANLTSVAEDRYAPVKEFQGGFSVMKRRPLLRAIARHILIQHRGNPDRPLSMQRSPEEARKLAEKVRQEVNSDGSNWRELVRRYHEEPETTPLDGTLGCIGNGDLSPALEEALLRTEPGRVAEGVVESPGGFHILWRVK